MTSRSRTFQASSSTTSTSSEPRVLQTFPGVFGYSAWKNLSVGVWVGQATVPAVRCLLEMSEELVLRHPEGRSSVVFVLDQLPAPTPEAQLELARVYGRPGLACMATVLEGSGFWASGIRSMTNNMKRGAPGSLVGRVNTTVDEVIAWLPSEHERQTGVRLSPEELRAVLATVRVEAEARARAHAARA